MQFSLEDVASIDVEVEAPLPKYVKVNKQKSDVARHKKISFKHLLNNRLIAYHLHQVHLK